MIVKDLIKKLGKTNPNAAVCLEIKNNPEAKKLYLITHPDKNDCVYITDDFSSVIDELTGCGFKVKKIN